MQRFLPRLALVLVLAAPALAETPNADVEILDYGLYAAGPKIHVPDASQLTGRLWLAPSIRLLEQTDIIPGQLDRIFGFRFRVNDPRLQGKSLQLRILHPRLTAPSGRSASETTRSQEPSLAGERAQFFAFEYLWEIAEGDWTMQVMHQGRVLAEKKFRVIVSMY